MKIIAKILEFVFTPGYHSWILGGIFAIILLSWISFNVGETLIDVTLENWKLVWIYFLFCGIVMTLSLVLFWIFAVLEFIEYTKKEKKLNILGVIATVLFSILIIFLSSSSLNTLSNTFRDIFSEPVWYDGVGCEVVKTDMIDTTDIYEIVIDSGKGVKIGTDATYGLYGKTDDPLPDRFECNTGLYMVYLPHTKMAIDVAPVVE